jgi:hypothetical protein
MRHLLFDGKEKLRNNSVAEPRLFGAAPAPAPAQTLK